MLMRRGYKMAQIFEKLNKNGLVLKGNVVDVCEILKEETKNYKGMSVATYLKLRKLQKAEEKQFGQNIWS